MESRCKIAAEKKLGGTHNCAQAVIDSYTDIAGIDSPTAMAMASAFGTGMGNMEGTCGALVGAGMVLGLVTRDRVKARAQMKQVMTRFAERNGATQCKHLKGVGTGCPLRECHDCVADACEFLEQQL